MFFQIPTRVYQQDNCVLANSKNIAKLGRKALIVTGKSSKNNGSLDDVVLALKNENIEYEIFDGIVENPPVELIIEAKEKYKDSGIEFVIGIGGGSALDGAKAIALMLNYKEKDGAFLYNPIDDYSYLPMVAVPTTCGTGSEVTGAAVITRHDKATKQSISYKIYPTIALVDGKYIEKLPHSILANTSIDTLGHLVESYINPTNMDYSNMLIEEGLKTWAKCKNALLTGKSNKEDLKNLMLSSTLAGMAIAHCGTSLPHGASYVLTYHTGMPHGKAVGYFLYGYIKNADVSQIDTVLKLTDFQSLNELKEFIVRVCNIEKADDTLLEKCVAELLSNERKLAHCPYRCNEDIIRDIIYSI